MDLYDQVSSDSSERLTRAYSTSFGLSSTLFPRGMRTHIYAIYALVRIADEIVDTYRGEAAGTLLDELEHDVGRACTLGYSANPIVHAFARSARQFDFDPGVITAFFASMRMDLAAFENTKAAYDRYIYGSAEAVGLLCLHVFVDADKQRYAALSEGARALGAAYQKINFLRDLASDQDDLGRWYFPNTSYETFDEAAKKAVMDDIWQDIAVARDALAALPRSARRATKLSLEYYTLLAKKLEAAPVELLKRTRLRVPASAKLLLYVKARLTP